MFWRKKNKHQVLCMHHHTRHLPSQVHYTKENPMDYINLDDDTLKIRLADGNVHDDYRIMLGTDKRATITCHRAHIREGDICAFRFKVTENAAFLSPCHRL
ncbi:hypothetical protein CFC21_112520 [Triticum aestivum]|uniref:TF-B3 domain-containing protein n=2 Tax=Triticum aestivum TaxID=4565 RepID=A0A9R0G4Y0_WHEAT|nr:hypothetical protein [Triticum aestivum]